MSNAPAKERWMDSVLGPCACSQLRRTARAVSNLYDEFLAPSGLTVTQYAVLVTIARAGAIARTKLAEQLGMDRTTLTRNLRPLERDELVEERSSEDRRERSVQLTRTGRQRLEKAYEHWTHAQQMFLSNFGEKRMQQLEKLLATATHVTKQRPSTESPKRPKIPANPQAQATRR